LNVFFFEAEQLASNGKGKLVNKADGRNVIHEVDESKNLSK